MRELKFGWHMHSFPVDGSSGAAFIDQIHTTLQRIHPHIDSVWVDDQWNLPGGTAAIYAHKLDVLRRHCAAVGRDYDSIVKTWSSDGIAVAPSEDEARRIAQASPYNTNAIIGTPEQVAQQLQVFIDLGVEYLIVRVLDFPVTAGIELFVQEVMPRLRAAQGR